MPSTPSRAQAPGGPGTVGDPESVALGASDTERPPGGANAPAPNAVAPNPPGPITAGPDAAGPSPGDVIRTEPIPGARPALRAAPPHPAGAPSSSQRLAAAPPRAPSSSQRVAPAAAHGPGAASRAAARGSAASARVTAVEVVSEANTAAPAAAPDVLLTRRCASCDARYPADFLVCPRDATPLSDEAGGAVVDPLVGKLLGETYQIVRVVGEGGMGRVYEARHLRLKERRFAVKTLHAELARNVEMSARFMREAESASSLSHPNVIDVFDVHHLPDGTPYFVGEFLEGEELAEYVEGRGPLEPRLAVSAARQVCSALAAAHARGIVHRDMKPENIFVLKSSIDAIAAGQSRTLIVKVLDFGISKAGGPERTHLTRTGVIMGTPSFMAPEQARGKPVDHRADVYAVGACLYFMITGKRPFDHEDPTSTISMVLTEDPQRPREIDERIPEMLELIVQKAMAKDARERYQSMEELDRALKAFERSISGKTTTEPGTSLAPGEAEPNPINRTGAQKAFDMAKAVLGTSSIAPPAVAPREAKLARPMIVMASTALAAWFIGGTASALGGLVRVLHEGEITATESVLLLVGCVFAAATPLGVYVAHVRRIWPNTMRALELANDLKRMMAAAFVTYGALTLVVRMTYTIFVRTSSQVASGLWDVTLFAASVLVTLTFGGFGPLLRNLRRRRSDPS